MATASCTTIGALYTACSRICILDEASCIHPCKNGNQACYFRGCVCGQMGNPTALWTDTQIHLFYDQVLACVSITPGNCAQDDQEIFWDTHVGLCGRDNFIVPGSLKPAGFGMLEVENGGSTTIPTSSPTQSPNPTSSSTSSTLPPTSDPAPSKSGSKISTADIIGLTVSFVGLFIGINFGVLVFTWRRNEREP